MRINEFKEWLQEKPMNPHPLKDCVSRCKKVEKALKIDLDEEFKRDRGQTVLSKLKYTVDDEKKQRKAPASFGFKPDANLRFRFTDLRSATNKYLAFCEAVKK